MREPDEPGWQPRYTGDGPRDVGQGAGFGADLYALYRAGRVRLPDYAGWLADYGATVADAASGVSAAAAPAGNPLALQRIVGLCEELQGALRTMTIVTRDTGTALVQVAARYAQTDEEAARVFRTLMREDAGKYDEPTPRIPDPPAPGVAEPPPSPPVSRGPVRAQ